LLPASRQTLRYIHHLLDFVDDDIGAHDAAPTFAGKTTLYKVVCTKEEGAAFNDVVVGR
jgi:hypothetical protein